VLESYRVEDSEVGKERERERFRERLGSFGDRVGHWPCPLQKLRHLLDLVRAYQAWTGDPMGVHH
jgi:hypothetical protein